MGNHSKPPTMKMPPPPLKNNFNSKLLIFFLGLITSTPLTTLLFAMSPNVSIFVMPPLAHQIYYWFAMSPFHEPK